ncbi:MAG TPA: GTP-binding protein [Xanthobacteraceae bacterium]|nr:GTP-binding protein [Xanthobacteraceae bacterium]
MPDDPIATSDARRPGPPLPLTVLTGFLGAGKTSLLNRLLRDKALAGTAVLINEFGEIGLDHLLVEKISDDLVLLPSGCVCCTMRGDLIDALERLLRDLDNRRAHLTRVVLETTGLADPAPVLHTVMVHPYLVMRYRLDGVVTVVDAINGLATIDQHPEAMKQAAAADRLALAKTDLIDTPERRATAAQLTARLKRLNPAAPILDVAAGEATAARLINCGLYDPDSKVPDVRRWLAEEAYAANADAHGHHHHAEERIRSLALASDRALPAATFDMFLDLLRGLHGPNLLRVKGIVKIAEAPEQPVVIHGVQHVFHPPTSLPAWPDDDRRTRLVFITCDMDPRAISDLFDAFLGAAPIDRPDRAALTDNPLVPFGGRDDRA